MAASVLYENEVCLCGTEQPVIGHHCPTLGKYVFSSVQDFVGGIALSAMSQPDK